MILIIIKNILFNINFYYFKIGWVGDEDPTFDGLV